MSGVFISRSRKDIEFAVASQNIDIRSIVFF